jgi:dolichyl-phosphate-mannose-protein mannosyltransferase
MQTREEQGKSRRDYLLLTLLALLISCASLVYYWLHHAILLYGDAIAHMNIARKVFDSRTPGILEFGTVWLPLPHLLDIPFVVNDWMWRTGLGASIPSMVAYIVGALGIFRLMRRLTSRTAAWFAALMYALNPNLIYIQATAMTESLYLAFFIWAVVYFSEFVQEISVDPQRARKLLERCGIMTAGAMMVRYDAWFLAAAIALAAFLVILKLPIRTAPPWRGFINFTLLAAATGGVWLAYNYGAFYHALEFATGPYSAKAIAKRMAGMPTYPGMNDPRTAALYFLKVSRLNVGEGPTEYLLFITAIITTIAVVYFARRYSAWLLLWVPIPFYVFSIAYSGVPIYFPNWWPYSYYNVRYGLELLPAICIFVALGYEFLGRFMSVRVSAAIVVLMVAVSYHSALHKTAICLREAQVNGKARTELTARLAAELSKLPPKATLMMFGGWYPGALQSAGIHFRRVLRESNHPDWEEGLSHPAQAADYIIAEEGDEVFYSTRLFPQKLRLIATVETPTQPKVFIYQSLH